MTESSIVPRKPNKTFRYYNKEMHYTGGKKVIRTVKIHNGKGHKSVKKYIQKRCMGTATRQLSEDEIHKIHNHKFIKGLFNDCKICRTRKKRCPQN